MEKEQFKRMFYETLQTMEDLKEIKSKKEEDKKEQINKQLKDIKKYLKANYNKKIFCYTIYDLKDHERLLTQFNNIDDLLAYIHKYENTRTTKGSLKSTITQNKIINDRFKIVVDKLTIEDLKDDIEKGYLYDNKSYIYE